MYKMSKLFSLRYYRHINNTLVRCFSQNVCERNKKVYSVLKPYLDFDERLENRKHLERSIKLRGLDVQLTSLITLWQHYKQVGKDLHELEKEKIRIAEEISQIKDTDDGKKIDALKFSGVNVREDIKRLRIVLSQMEEQIFPRVLQLPNDVIERNGEVLFSIDNSETEATNHLEVGKHLGILEYVSPRSYFLKGPAASFELHVSGSAARLFTNKNFLQFSNPDFTRNSVVKYLNLMDIQSLLSLEKQHDDVDVDRLHLLGGASLLPFCCFHCKTIIDNTSLPIRYVTKGRHYTKSQLPGLYGVWQNTSVQIFIGSDEHTMHDQLNTVINMLTDFYAIFKIPIRIIYCPTETLSRSEKLRISFQTYSFIYEQFIEIGNVSLYGDYISKRLRIYYSDKDENKFMHLISGTVLKIPPLLASVLEYKQFSRVQELFNKK